jgi:membrane peptidoglycan carboxypeptidase
MAERTTGARRGSTGPARAASGTAATDGSAKPPRPVWQKRLLTTLKVVTVAVLVIALLGMGAVAVAYQRTNLPDPNAAFLTNKSNVYYRDGKTVIGSFADQNRTSISYADMPQTIKDAVVAAENRTFWTDKGISPTGIARAVYGILRGKSALGGGSTITQEYIKILYLTSDQTASRKITEVLLAVKMGRSMPKEQILQGYLNTIYFGRGAYGIQAAAKAYFNVDAKNLTLQQSIVLASVLNNPSMYDPADGEKNVARLTNRYAYVLDGMVQMGTVTQAQADAAKALPAFPDVPKSSRYGGPKGFLLKMVESELTADGFDPATISGGGLQITTTFDEKAQAAAVASAQKYTDEAANGAKTKQDPTQLHAAIASVAVGSGEVLALYGGPDYLASSRNWGTTDRPAASTFKAYAVVAGLRNGFSLRSTLNGNTFTPRGDTSTIRNEFNTQYGQVSLVKATAESINTAFVDLTQQIPNGPAQIIKAANDAGVTTGAGWDANNRIALGTAEVSPLDQATGYATLANGGTYVPSHIVKEVKDLTGKVLYTAKPQAQPNIDPKIATDTTYALENVVNEGTGAKVSSLGRDIAGKTGTADVNGHVVSSWFIGYTKQVSTAVMYVAGDGGNGNLDVYAKRGDATFFGGTYPALTWLDYMKVATDGQPKLSFDPPVYVNATATPSPVASSAPVDTPTPTPSTPAPSPSSSSAPPPPPAPSQPKPSPTQATSSKPSSSASPAVGKPSASAS